MARCKNAVVRSRKEPPPSSSSSSSSSSSDSDSSKPPPQKIQKRNPTEQKPQLLTLEETKKQTKCMECETKDSETKMYICETCLKFDDQEDVKKHALCSHCTIKKHMRQGHQTVDFFPYLRAHHFSAQSKLITQKVQRWESVRECFNDKVCTFNDVSASVTEKYNVLTNMAQRSKCTKSQVELFEKMETFIDESTLIELKAKSELMVNLNMLQEKLKTIEKWYLCRMGDCVDESELIKVTENKVNLSESTNV